MSLAEDDGQHPLRYELHLSNPLEASAYYEGSIFSGDHIVVVGPSNSVFRDATGLVAARLSDPGGHVYFADPIGEDPVERLAWVQGGPIVPVGGVNLYQSHLDTLKAYGVSLVDTTWLGATSGVFHIPLPDDSVDVLIDHNTTAYVYDITRSMNIGFSNFFPDAFKEYLRVLRPGGRLLFQTDCAKYSYYWGIVAERLRTEITDLLGRMGASVTFHNVTDVQRVALTRELANLLMSVTISDAQEQEHQLSQYIIYDADGAYLTFEYPHWASPDLYLAVKN